MDKTKHEKIFVLNKVDEHLSDPDEFFDKIYNLKKKLNQINEDQARVELSDILHGYTPNINYGEKKFNFK